MIDTKTKIKVRLKRVLIFLIQSIGPFVVPRVAREFIRDNFIPLMLDQRLISRDIVYRKMRHFEVLVPCEPYNYIHWNNYWFGIFHEEELELYMRAKIKPGDTIIDVGMNIGHVALPGCKLVGKDGAVIGFEPNPTIANTVRQCAAVQGLNQLRVICCGLGAESSELTLYIDPLHIGGASFKVKYDSDGDEKKQVITCPIVRADEALKELDPSSRIFLKIDVEGCELEVILGFGALLTIISHAVIEISPEWLTRTDIDKIFSHLSAHGFEPFHILRSGGVGEIANPNLISRQENILFIRSSK